MFFVQKHWFLKGLANFGGQMVIADRKSVKSYTDWQIFTSPVIVFRPTGLLFYFLGGPAARFGRSGSRSGCPQLADSVSRGVQKHEKHWFLKGFGVFLFKIIGF